MCSLRSWPRFQPTGCGIPAARRVDRIILITCSSASRRRASSRWRPSVPTTPCAYDYAVIRVVPRVEREEFINAGVILSCPARDFLDARVHLDRGRLLALCPDVDVELVQQHLEAIPALCRG